MAPLSFFQENEINFIASQEYFEDKGQTHKYWKGTREATIVMVKITTVIVQEWRPLNETP